uniref:Uncharacterized protein n=1 Tax=Opuntia streptacantha TaxID=393608 RepID=A0A7C9E136_OPUST
MDSEESSRYGRIKRWSFNKVSCVQNVDVLDQSIPPVDANSKATGSPRVRRIKRPSGSWITDVPDLASPSLVPPATETKYEIGQTFCNDPLCPKDAQKMGGVLCLRLQVIFSNWLNLPPRRSISWLKRLTVIPYGTPF